MIRYLEDVSTQCCENSEVFELTVNNITESNNPFIFSCSIHKTEVMSDIVVYYITMGMRQYTIFKNKTSKKKNCLNQFET